MLSDNLHSCLEPSNTVYKTEHPDLLRTQTYLDRDQLYLSPSGYRELRANPKQDLFHI